MRVIPQLGFIPLDSPLNSRIHDADTCEKLGMSHSQREESQHFVWHPLIASTTFAFHPFSILVGKMQNTYNVLKLSLNKSTKPNIIMDMNLSSVYKTEKLRILYVNKHSGIGVQMIDWAIMDGIDPIHGWNLGENEGMAQLHAVPFQMRGSAHAEWHLMSSLHGLQQQRSSCGREKSNWKGGSLWNPIKQTQH